MAKTKLTDLAKELDIDFIKAMGMTEEHCEDDQVTGKGKNTWLTEEAVEKIKAVAEVPEIVPEYHMGEVLKGAENPNYIWVHIRQLKKKVPVVIPRRYYGKLIGKKIKIEEIKDARGKSSFRYVRPRLYS